MTSKVQDSTIVDSPSTSSLSSVPKEMDDIEIANVVDESDGKALKDIDCDIKIANAHKLNERRAPRSGSSRPQNTDSDTGVGNSGASVGATEKQAHNNKRKASAKSEPGKARKTVEQRQPKRRTASLFEADSEDDEAEEYFQKPPINTAKGGKLDNSEPADGNAFSKGQNDAPNPDTDGNEEPESHKKQQQQQQQQKSDNKGKRKLPANWTVTNNKVGKADNEAEIKRKPISIKARPGISVGAASGISKSNVVVTNNFGAGDLTKIFEQVPSIIEKQKTK